MPLPKIKHQQFTINIGAAGQVVPIDIETDKLYDTLTKLDVTITDVNAKFSTLQLDIDNTEIFPEKFQMLRVLFKEQAPGGYESHELNLRAGGSKVVGKYTDVPLGASYPYQVTLTLILENKHKQ